MAQRMSPEYEHPLKEVVGSLGSGLVGFHLIELFAISRNWLIWGSGVMGTVRPGSAKPQMSKCQNTENEGHG